MHRQYKSYAENYALVIEDIGSGISLIQDLKEEGIRPVAFRPDEGDKVVRLVSQTARLESGGVHLPREAPWLPDFTAELLAFPGGRHDDQVDAFSEALIYDRRMQQSSIVVRPLVGLY